LAKLVPVIGMADGNLLLHARPGGPRQPEDLEHLVGPLRRPRRKLDPPVADVPDLFGVTVMALANTIARSQARRSRFTLRREKRLPASSVTAMNASRKAKDATGLVAISHSPGRASAPRSNGQPTRATPTSDAPHAAADQTRGLNATFSRRSTEIIFGLR
jgi:hypothetical protein